jgi:hypothetical protein
MKQVETGTGNRGEVEKGSRGVLGAWPGAWGDAEAGRRCQWVSGQCKPGERRAASGEVDVLRLIDIWRACNLISFILCMQKNEHNSLQYVAGSRFEPVEL